MTQRFVIQSCPTLTGGFLHVHNYGIERETCPNQTIWLCMLHSNFLFQYLHVLLLVRCLCVVAVLSQGIPQGAHHHCESFILIQILYIVGVLLMTFDLLTCGHSQGNGCSPGYISEVLSATITA